MYIYSPTERTTRAALRATAEKTNTEDNVVTRAVFHAPMFALNVFALENACEPTAHRPHGWKAYARPHAYTYMYTRAHTSSKSGRRQDRVATIPTQRRTTPLLCLHMHTEWTCSYKEWGVHIIMRVYIHNMCTDVCVCVCVCVCVSMYVCR